VAYGHPGPYRRLAGLELVLNQIPHGVEGDGLVLIQLPAGPVSSMRVSAMKLANQLAQQVWKMLNNGPYVRQLRKHFPAKNPLIIDRMQYWLYLWLSLKE
jgi:hypothetical protein